MPWRSGGNQRLASGNDTATSGDAVRATGLRVDTLLALGNPPNEIVKIAVSSGCDLIALASHGHKLIGDLIHGSTIDKVRHNTTIPLLVVSTKAK